MVAVILVNESIIEHILITYMPNQEGPLYRHGDSGINYRTHNHNIHAKSRRPLYCHGDSKEYIPTVEDVKGEENYDQGSGTLRA